MLISDLIKILNTEQTINIIDISVNFGAFIFSGAAADFLLSEIQCDKKIDSISVCEDFSIDVFVK